MNYNSPFMKMLETVANMLIVSFLWLLFSLPILTVVPSCTALYHTTCKVIFGEKRGNGVFKDFVDCFRLNLKEGVLLSLIVVVAVAFIAEGLWTGYQIYKLNIFGMLYMMLGILITLLAVSMAVYIAPVLSRFIAPVGSVLRLSAYFAIKKPLRSIAYALLFALMVLLVETIPLAIMILPAVYTDLLRPTMEKDMTTFINENNLESKDDEDEEEEEEQIEDSTVDLDKKLSDQRKKGKK